MLLNKRIFVKKIFISLVFVILSFNLAFLFPIDPRIVFFISVYCLSAHFFSFALLPILFSSLFIDAFFMLDLGTNFVLALFIIYCFSDLKNFNSGYYTYKPVDTDKILLGFCTFIIIWYFIFSVINYKLINLGYILRSILLGLALFKTLGLAMNKLYKTIYEKQL